MTNVSELISYFEADFANFERNRMYPPCHTKEPTMTYMDIRHVNAVTHAEYWLNERKDSCMGPSQRQVTEDDLLRLAELKMNIINSISNLKGLFEEV